MKMKSFYQYITEIFDNPYKWRGGNVAKGSITPKTSGIRENYVFKTADGGLIELTASHFWMTAGEKYIQALMPMTMEKEGHAPTASEIAEGIGIKSRGVVHRYLRALEAENVLHLLPKKHRNIQLLEGVLQGPAANQPLSLIGAIAAGQPIEAIVDHDPINIADIFLGENRYALRVKGDSMIDEGIFDGDIVVCEHARSASNGQIVVAIIDSNQATLKRIYHNPGERTVMLMPENKSLKPMVYPASRVQVQGIYIGLFRIAGF